MTTSKKLSLNMIAALLIMCFTFVAAAVISRTVFERLPHLEDEFAYYYQARIFAGWHAWVPRNEPVKYFWQPFVLQPENPSDGVAKRFGKYTPGWPLVLATGIWLGEPWVINAFFAMLSVGLVYRLGKEIFDEQVGLAAAIFLAISPMALLLNATLMSHTWDMFATLVFVYAYWRTTKHGRGRYRWAILGGLMLGGVAITRPLTGLAMAAPVALHGLVRLYNVLHTGELWPRLRVMIVMALCVLPILSIWPLFNTIWTGNPTTNTYTLLWSYDRVGFGPDIGRNAGGHTLTWGWRNTRADLEYWFRDIFGMTLDPTLAAYAWKELGWGGGIGLGWIPIAVGLFLSRKKGWVWFFFAFFAAIVVAGLFYWIGSVVRGEAAYSLRYYYEGTFGVCLVAGCGVVEWARSFKRKRPQPAPTNWLGKLRLAWLAWWPGYFIFLVACGLSLAGYTPARFREPLPPDWPNGLYGYNKVGHAQLDAINAMRAQTPDKPVLIIVLNSPKGTDDNWRNYATAMTMTSPYLDSDIILVRVFEPENAPEMVKRFSGRLVLYQIGDHLYPSVEEALTKEAAH